MRTRHSSSRTAVALATAASLSLFPVPRRRARAGACGLQAPPQKPRRRRNEPVDGGWPKAFNAPSGATVMVYQPQVASWDEPEAHGGVFGGGATRPRAPRSRRSARQDRSRHERGPRRAARELPASCKITESNFPTLTKRAAAGDRRARSTKAIPIERARDRARSRARQHRQEPDHARRTSRA